MSYLIACALAAGIMPGGLDDFEDPIVVPGDVLALADVDGDGRADAIVNEEMETGFVLGYRASDGVGFGDVVMIHQAPFGVRFAESYPRDVNQDGHMDLVTVDDTYPLPFVYVHLNDGAGGFVFDDQLDLIKSSGDSRFLGDVDADGDDDMLFAVNVSKMFRIEVYENVGGAFEFAGLLGTFTEDQVPLVVTMRDVVDLNGDGYDDFVLIGITDDFQQRLLTIINNEGAGLRDPRIVAVAQGMKDAIGVDLDGLNDADVVVSHDGAGGPQFSVVRSDGAGAYETPVVTPVDAAPRQMIALDVDGDGDNDVAAASMAEEAVLQALLNDGAGHVEAAPTLTTGIAGAGQRISMGDMDGDGRMDLAMTTDADMSAVFPGAGCVADFNDDGELNILDFVAFQASFLAGDEAADVNGDGVHNVLDFVTFQKLFVFGCGGQ